MEKVKTHRCEDCSWRKKAESNPKTFLAWLWRIHTRICPGWKAYQKSIKNVS